MAPVLIALVIFNIVGLGQPETGLVCPDGADGFGWSPANSPFFPMVYLQQLFIGNVTSLRNFFSPNAISRLRDSKSALKSKIESFSHFPGHEGNEPIIFPPNSTFYGFIAVKLQEFPNRWEDICHNLYAGIGGKGTGVPIPTDFSVFEVLDFLKKAKIEQQPLDARMVKGYDLIDGESGTLLATLPNVTEWSGGNTLMGINISAEGNVKVFSYKENSSDKIQGLCFTPVPKELGLDKEKLVSKIDMSFELASRVVQQWTHKVRDLGARSGTEDWHHRPILILAPPLFLHAFHENMEKCFNENRYMNIGQEDIEIWENLLQLSRDALVQLQDDDSLPIRAIKHTSYMPAGVPTFPSSFSFVPFRRAGADTVLGYIKVTVAIPFSQYIIQQTPGLDGYTLADSVLVEAEAAELKTRYTTRALNKACRRGLMVADECYVDLDLIGRVSPCAQALGEGSRDLIKRVCEHTLVNTEGFHENLCAKTLHYTSPGDGIGLTADCDGQQSSMSIAGSQTVDLTAFKPDRGCSIYSKGYLVYGNGVERLTEREDEEEETLVELVEDLSNYLQITSVFSLTTSILSIFALVFILHKIKHNLRPCLEAARQINRRRRNELPSDFLTETNRVYVRTPVNEREPPIELIRRDGRDAEEARGRSFRNIRF